jgi:quercetin dioxygenase-like cupin family protein
VEHQQVANPIIQFHGGDESTGNVFAVETIAPAGMTLESHKHEHSHMSVLAVGVADVTIDGKTERHTGPVVLTIPANTFHSVRAVTDVAWYCLWAGDIAPREQAEQSLRLCHEAATA